MAKWFLATPWKALPEMAAKHCCCPHWSCCDVPSFGLNTKELLIALGWAQSACPPSHSLTSSSHYLLSRHLFLSFISNLNPPWDFYFGSLLSGSHSHWPHGPSSALRTMLSTQLLTLNLTSFHSGSDRNWGSWVRPLDSDQEKSRMPHQGVQASLESLLLMCFPFQAATLKILRPWNPCTLEKDLPSQGAIWEKKTHKV